MMFLNKIIVGGYFVLLICTTLYYRIQNKKNAIKSRPTLNNSFALAIAVFVNSVGGGTIFGLGEKTFSGDLNVAYGLLLAITSDIAFGILVTPRIAEKRHFFSIGGLMEEHYGKSGRIFSGICAAIVSIGYIAIQINVSSKIFAHILGIESTFGAILSYIVVVTYTLIGGLKSTLKTNLIQCIALIISIPVISIFSFQRLKGQNFVPDFIESMPLNFWSIEVLCTALGFACMGLDPAAIKRNLIAKTPGMTTSATFIKSFVYAVCILLMTFNGLAAKYLFPTIAPTSVIPTLVNQILPAGISGIVIIGLFAAVMSTADASIQMATESIHQDILMPFKEFIKKDPKTIKLISKFLTVAFGSISIVAALKFEYAIDLAFFVAGAWFPLIAVPLIALLYKVYISKLGIFVSAGVSFTSFIYVEMYPAFGLKSVFVATLVSCITFSAIRLIEKRIFKH